MDKLLKGDKYKSTTKTKTGDVAIYRDAAGVEHSMTGHEGRQDRKGHGGVGIYRGSLAYAQSPYLVDLREPQRRRTASVSPLFNERAWRSVDRWIAKWRESNLEDLRRRKQDPLAGSKLSFW